MTCQWILRGKNIHQILKLLSNPVVCGQLWEGSEQSDSNTLQQLSLSLHFLRVLRLPLSPHVFHMSLLSGSHYLHIGTSRAYNATEQSLLPDQSTFMVPHWVNACLRRLSPAQMETITTQMSECVFISSDNFLKPSLSVHASMNHGQSTQKHHL